MVQSDLKLRSFDKTAAARFGIVAVRGHLTVTLSSTKEVAVAAYWSISKPFLYWLTLAAIIVALTIGTVAQAEEDDEVLARVLADLAAQASPRSSVTNARRCSAATSS